MYYSLTFNVNGVSKNTWTDWKLIPDTPPVVPYPELNTTYVDIPGRSGGPLDLTGVPFNKLTYKRMTGSWNFLFEPTTSSTRKNLYETLCQYFNGRVGKVTLEEDSTHYFKGRFTVGTPRTGQGPCQIQIGFDLEPVRYLVSNNNVDTNYARETI